MVHKKTGNILASVLLLFSMGIANAASISLTFLDDHNRSCRDADVGTHYRLEARIQGTTVKGWPHIAGLPADVVTGRQQRQEVSWLQGKKTESTCFVWEIMFTMPGPMTLGPVSYTDDTGKIINSASLSIPVHEHPANSTTAGKSNAATSTFIRWELDRLDPFAGEVIPARLVLYTTDDSIQLESISEIRLEGAHLELTKEPTWASALHNGISYKTATWEGILSVQSAGILSMPLVTISYRIGSSQAHSYSPWAMMHRMLNSFSRQYHKRSAALSLQVRALPPTQHAIAGVGHIYTATRTCSDQAMHRGEASSMTYRLQGSIHPNCLQLPVPETVEHSAKMYSSSYTHRGTYPSYHYEQEYIIHPHEAGRVSFPEQMLWYFNPEKELYESCIIPAFEIDVQPSQKMAPAEEKKSDMTIDPSNIEHENKKTSPFTMPSLPLQPILPLRLFLLLLALPCIIAASKYWLYRQLRRMYYAITLQWIRRVTLRKIPLAAQHSNGYMILHLMRHAIRTIHNIPHHVSESEFIAQSLIARGAERKQIEEWHELWSDMQKAAFSAPLRAEEYESLQNRCCKWINIL